MAACQSVPRQDDSLAFEFAIVGDGPSVDYNEPKYDRMIEVINARQQLQWVIHVGDLKGGGQSCDDAMLRARYDLNQRFQFPFILTPGDNDWFDCSGASAGGYDPYERLDFLRELFYPNAQLTTGHNPIPVISQADDPQYGEFVENVRWTHNGIVFATLHLVALNPGSSETPRDAKRMNAALACARQAFQEAEEIDAAGIFLATQVDPWIFSGLPGLLKLICPACPIIRPSMMRLHTELVDLSKQFDRPIILAVGDTHVYRVDKPLYDLASGQLVEHFSRVEVFGHPNVHWVRVKADPATEEVFEIHQQLIRENFGQP
jgi:predicted phosphodiesterase